MPYLERHLDPPKPASRAPEKERRRAARHACSLPVTLRPVGQSFPIYAQISDLGLNGIYVKSVTPPARGRNLGIELALDGTTIRARGVVRTSHGGVGAGIEFTEIAAGDLALVQRQLEKLQQQEKEARATNLMLPRRS